MDYAFRATEASVTLSDGTEQTALLDALRVMAVLAVDVTIWMF